MVAICLGSSLWMVLDLLRALPHVFPQVDVKYDTANPVSTPVLLHIRPHIDLLFSPIHQRLSRISLRLQNPTVINYRDKVLCSGAPDEPLLRNEVNRQFGPTFTGDALLRYPGVTFYFDRETAEDERMQRATQVVVTQKRGSSGDPDALEEVSPCPIMDGDLERAVIKVATHYAIARILLLMLNADS